MPVLWKGQKSAFQGEEWRGTPGVGVEVTRRFGGERNAMFAKFNDHFNGGWNTVFVRDGDSPIWRVEATIQGDPNKDPSDQNSNIVDIHELKVNVLNPSNLTSPYLKSLFSIDAGNTPEAKLAYVNRLYTDYMGSKIASYDEAVGKIFGDSDSPFDDPTEAARAQDLFGELVQGVTHYVQFQYVYRHTFNYGNLAAKTADFSNVGAYFTAAELITEESIPTTGTDGVQVPPGEWLKIAPEQNRQLGQRKQLVYEYWWAEQWSRLHYPPAV